MGTGRTGGAILAVGVAVAACGARTELATTVPTPTLVTACTKLLSCAPPALSVFKGNYTSVSDCLWTNVDTFGQFLDLAGAFPQFVLTNDLLLSYAPAACLAAASGCGAVSDCVTGGVPVECPKNPLEGSCVGDLAIRCEQGQPLAIDCASSPFYPGSHCMLSAGAEPACGVGTCSGQSTSCDGNVRMTCGDGGVLLRMPCPPDTRCRPVQSGSGPVGCDGASGGCINPHCEGDVRVQCSGGGAMRVDCAALAIPGGCDSSALQTSLPFRDNPCVPSPQLACNPETHADRCDGTRLVYCDGQERSIDCATIGFHACGTSRGYAACE